MRRRTCTCRGSSGTGNSALARAKRRWRERAYQGQGTVATHAVASNADSVRVQLLEGSKESFGKILSNVRIHVVALVVRLLCGIDVESGT